MDFCAHAASRSLQPVLYCESLSPLFWSTAALIRSDRIRSDQVCSEYLIASIKCEPRDDRSIAERRFYTDWIVLCPSPKEITDHSTETSARELDSPAAKSPQMCERPGLEIVMCCTVRTYIRECPLGPRCGHMIRSKGRGLTTFRVFSHASPKLRSRAVSCSNY